MAGLNELGIELRSSVLFAAVSFIVSMLVGIIAGIDMAVVFIRVLVIVPVFAMLGYGLILVIKRYVPEFYEFLTGRAPDIEAGESAAGSEEVEPEIPEPAAEEPAGDSPAYEEKGDEPFTELSAGDFPKMSSTGEGGSDLDSNLNLDSGRLGKHIISNEKVVKYEPKIMAQAIRTMISRDED